LAQLSALVTADDVTQGKPHPETFVRAAELMGVAPQHCVVFEDTDMGRKAAVDGGMACFMVDNTRLIY
ncbi:MAG TPA: carotenoid dehydrogenase, partial [Alteromonas macleodii]|nr:carotenoid dehydrogenase [Alteromonas macleodii]HAX26809.1 carotenoid dehydrogenase [Alteromonas macleodii]